jgi:hypothetical protein
MLNFSEFKDSFITDCRRRLDAAAQRGCGDIEIEERSVTKAQRGALSGIIFKAPDTVCAPTYYVEDFYSMYKEGHTVEELTDVLVQNAYHYIDHPPILAGPGTEALQDPAKLRVRLLNKARNSEYLKDVPSIDEDCGLTLIAEVRSGEFRAVVTNDLLDSLGMTEDELFRIALENSSDSDRAFLSNLYDVLVMGPDSCMNLLDEPFVEVTLQPGTMYVLSNESLYWGAAALFYPGMLAKLTEMMGGDFYVLPSSVHKVLLISALGASRPMLADILATSRKTAADSNSYLSDDLFVCESGRLKKVDLGMTGHGSGPLPS